MTKTAAIQIIATPEYSAEQIEREIEVARQNLALAECGVIGEFEVHHKVLRFWLLIARTGCTAEYSYLNC